VSELKRILLVDDDEDLRAIAAMSLEATGDLAVKGCASAEEALATFAEFEPDMVLLDVEMPGTDGPAALAAFRESRHADVPVVFCTARTEPEQVQRLLGLGAIDVIHKPFDPLELAATIRKIWDGLTTG
jgi:DNA-binding response OmpR family regulator